MPTCRWASAPQTIPAYYRVVVSGFFGYCSLSGTFCAPVCVAIFRRFGRLPLFKRVFFTLIFLWTVSFHYQVSLSHLHLPLDSPNTTFAPSAMAAWILLHWLWTNSPLAPTCLSTAAKVKSWDLTSSINHHLIGRWAASYKSTRRRCCAGMQCYYAFYLIIKVYSISYYTHINNITVCIFILKLFFTVIFRSIFHYRIIKNHYRAHDSYCNLFYMIYITC